MTRPRRRMRSGYSRPWATVSDDDDDDVHDHDHEEKEDE
jgi:hypothetical protein